MLFYYTLVLIAVGTLGPFLLMAEKRRAGLLQKLGFVPRQIRQGLARSSRPLWFHAVSVGEFNAIYPLITRLLEKNPHLSAVVSTTTQTGQKLACERLLGKVPVFYFPLDLPWSINNWLNVVNPCLVAIAETEIWPGFIYECFRRKIPVVLVNGRMSPKSFASYCRWKLFFGKVIGRLSFIAAQTETDAQRYQLLAKPCPPIVVMGNLKFDGMQPIDGRQQAQLRGLLGINPDDWVVIGGSTHAGEEEALLTCLAQLQAESLLNTSGRQSNCLRLVLAPRHPDRWHEVKALIASHGYNARCFSDKASFESDNDVYLLDSIGQLFAFYSLASVAFVGGTLVPIGGHSLAEPCAYAVPVVCGPSLYKTQDVAYALQAAGVLTIVQNRAELSLHLSKLFRERNLARELGEKGYAWLKAEQGAVARTVEWLESLLIDTSGEVQQPCLPMAKRQHS